MRGSPLTAIDEHEPVGIIPAHAGLTEHEQNILGQEWDHPRACGAHSRRAAMSTSQEGSSPRMRGSHNLFFGLCPDEGIIPAHAGLTRRGQRLLQSSWDHPRACGAHSPDSRMTRTVLGSSPRMRGSRAGRKEMKFEDGIIPAHAGLTPRGPSSAAAQRDHPRACGAHLCIPFRYAGPKGSSPRMRGSH